MSSEKTILETSHHQDSSRSKVGHTALFVALLRSAEHNSENSLIDDPFAKNFIEEKEASIIHLMKEKGPNDPQSFRYGVAVRTRKIDDELLRAIREGIDQVVVVGAGLDCRAWRLGKCRYGLPGDEQLFQKVNWFEMDFVEVLEYKKNVLKEFKTICQSYVSVTTDLSLPTWTEKFLQTSYNPKKRSIWLLEGFTTYLTEEELSLFMNRLSTVALEGSYLIATFLGPDSPNLKLYMHKFFTKTPELFVKNYGWEGDSKTIPNIGKEEYQHVSEDDRWSDYRLLIAKKK